MKILLTFFVLLFSTSVFAKNVAFVKNSATKKDYNEYIEKYYPSIEGKFVYLEYDPSHSTLPGLELIYFTEEPTLGTESIYLTSNCLDADVEVVSGSPTNAEWVYFTHRLITNGPIIFLEPIPSARADWIYITSTSSSADYTICFPSSFKIFRKHIAAIYVLYLKEEPERQY